MSLNPTTFIELWRAWGPLLATVFGGMSLIIAALVLGYREREKEIRCLRDAAGQREIAANDRYIALLGQVLAAMGTMADSQGRVVEALDALREAQRLADRIASVEAGVGTALDRLGRGGGGRT